DIDNVRRGARLIKNGSGIVREEGRAAGDVVEPHNAHIGVGDGQRRTDLVAERLKSNQAAGGRERIDRILQRSGAVGSRRATGVAYRAVSLSRNLWNGRPPRCAVLDGGDAVASWQRTAPSATRSRQRSAPIVRQASRPLRSRPDHVVSGDGGWSGKANLTGDSGLCGSL